MKRKLIIGFLICVVLFLLSGFIPPWLERRKELQANQLPEIAYQAILSDSTLTLFSLDPMPPQEPSSDSLFHGYRILGQTTVSADLSRRQIADTLKHNLTSWRFTMSSCFNPRHGVRAILSGQTYDFLICFECHELYYYPPSGEEQEHGFGDDTTIGPFADILSAARIPIAKDQ